MTYNADPITMQNRSFMEVIELYADLRRLQIRQEEEAEKRPKNKSNVIRQRASDDAGWW